MSRQPTRIHPSVGSQEERVVTFRDGPQLLTGHLAACAEADSYPDLSYQEWVEKVANKQTEDRVVRQAIGLTRLGHFAR